MRKFKLFSMMLIAVLVLSACQAGVNNETPAASAEEPVQATVEDTSATNETTEDTTSQESTTEEAVTEEKSEETEAKVSEEASEEVSGFPEKDKKIPGYELTMRDGSTIKLDQYEGQVVMMTFFTTW